MTERKDPKSTNIGLSRVAQRREKALRNQKEQRRALLQKLRNVEASEQLEAEAEAQAGGDRWHSASTPPPVSMEGSMEEKKDTPTRQQRDVKMGEDDESKRRAAAEHRRRQIKAESPKWAALLTVPEWLTETPSDLGEEWTVMARPVGERCLVRSKNGRTTVRSRDGRVIAKFMSGLPSGNRRGQLTGHSMLDCIWNEELRTYFVLDMIQWTQLDLSNAGWEMRQFFRQKVDELELGTVRLGNERKFVLVPALTCNKDNLEKAYTEKSFPIDGLLFHHIQGLYNPGPSCLVSVWKDDKCSRWMIQSTDGKNANQFQTCVLRVRPPKEAGQRTLDLESREQFQLCTIQVNQLPASRTGREQEIGELTFAKIQVKAVDITNQKLEVHKVQGFRGRRTHADLFSKIAFQHQARMGQAVSYDSLRQVVIKSTFNTDAMMEALDC